VKNTSIVFYGHSFIADHTGAVVAQADDHSEAVLVSTFDLGKIRAARHAWGLFRDRRPELYTPILTKDGSNRFYGV
jgi:N-carbamoylputrescine amidase